MTRQNNPLFIALFCATAAFLSAGCQAPMAHLNDRQERIAAELARISPLNDPLPAKTPIIDIHTHTFNARYLPLKGILLGKRDALFPLTTLISDHCAELIAQSIDNCTTLDPIPNGGGSIARHPETTGLRATEHPGWICRIFLSIIDDAIKSGAWDFKGPVVNNVPRLDQMADHMSMTQKIAVRAAANMMGMQDHVKGGKKTEGTITGYQAFMRFLWTLTLGDSQIYELFHEMHATTQVNGKTVSVPMLGPITMLSHTMDLAPVYNQHPDGANLIDFPDQQINRMEYFQHSDSNLLYFVAYNPYRDHWPDAAAPKSLEVVRDAIEHHGAWGVKVYPPSGYRAAGNEIKSRPWAPLTRYPGKEWDARYASLGKDKDAAMDSELNALLEWCVAEDVPVLVHCGYGEFEARKGYGEYHSNPIYWKKYLESHSTPGHPCTLRLCLGHAGGEDHWFGTGTHSSWGECVYELCTNYPNVYCEITTSDANVERTRQAYFVDTVVRAFQDSANAPYPFSTKLMYGTDWPLPDQGEPGAVLFDTEKAFLYPALRPYYASYFCGNAKNFLHNARVHQKK